jgi:acetyl esterase/lipase
MQATKAIKHIKDNADEYGIDPENVFAVGFSAGGHLAASLGTMWKLPEIYNEIDMPYGYNKPKGVMLIYPVISSHLGSFKNLLATAEPTEEMIAKVSIDKRVDTDSSPAFIMHTANDQTVNVSNALDVAAAYSKAGVPFELHIYPDAPHGVALGNKITMGSHPKYENAAIAEWIRHAAVWADNI